VGAMNHKDIIRWALEDLQQQPVNSGAFVIFEDGRTGKFVQFCGSLSEPLLLDLPAQTLSEMEFHRAVAYFKRANVKGEEYDVFDMPGGRPVARQFSFQVPFFSANDAGDIAFGIFEEVYQLPCDWNLDVTRSWLEI
jgi:hypothetical protein